MLKSAVSSRPPLGVAGMTRQRTIGLDGKARMHGIANATIVTVIIAGGQARTDGQARLKSRAAERSFALCEQTHRFCLWGVGGACDPRNG